MGQVVCFDRAEQRSYQDGIDAADARAERVNAVHLELRTLMLAEMGNSAAWMPCVQYSAHRSLDREATLPMIEAVQDALDAAPAAEALHAALRDSECPLVRKLRVELANAYANGMFRKLAEVRGVA